MTGEGVVFIGLAANQALAGSTFLTVYSRSRWRASAIGRHLMFYTFTVTAQGMSWVLLLLGWPWLVWVLLGAQAMLGLLTWQRVRLVWLAQHRGGVR